MARNTAAKRNGLAPVPATGNRWGTFGERKRGPGLSLLDVPADLLARAAHAVIEDGAALLVARTSDGGAIRLQVLDGDTKPVQYCAEIGELEDALNALATG